MLRGLLLPLTYVIGYIITHYVIEEVKGKGEVFKRAMLFSVYFLALITFYELIKLDNLIILSLTVIIASLVLFLPALKNAKEWKSLFILLFMGVIAGVFYQSWYLILTSCFMLYFKSNKDYLNNSFDYKTLTIIALFYFSTLLLTTIFNNPDYNLILAAVSVTGLLRFSRL